jgi:hypothetical protein
MPFTYRQLEEPIVTVGTGTVIYVPQDRYRDKLYLEVTNLSATSATFDLFMGGEKIVASAVVDPNSPPYVVSENLVAWSTITANSVPSSAIVFMGHALRGI